MCCLIYKGTEVEGRELKLHRLTADKKLRKVRWSPLSETGQKGDSMFATVIRTAVLYYFISLFSPKFFQCIFKEDSQQNHPAYVLSILFLHYRHAA